MGANNNVVLNLKITGDGKDGTAAITSVVDGLKKLGVTAQDTGKKAAEGAGGMKEFGDSTADAVKEMVAMVAAAVGITQFLEVGKAALKNAQNLNEFSKETGVGIETLSVLQFAARKAGLDVVELRGAFNNLSVSLREVQQGNVATQQMFHAIGLDWRTLINLPLDQVLLKVGSALDQFTDGATKNIVAQQLLGPKATKLIGTLQSLAGDGFGKLATEAERVGAVVRESTVRAAEELEAATVSLRSQTEALSLSFWQGLVPGVVTATNEMDNLTGSTEGARGVFGTLGTFIGNMAKGVVYLLNGVTSEINFWVYGLTRSGAAIAKAAKLAAGGHFVEAGQALQDADKKINAFIATTESEDSLLLSNLFGKPADVKGAAAATRDAALAALDQMLKQVRAKGVAFEQFDATKMTTAEITAKTRELGGLMKRALQLQDADIQAILKAQSDARLAALDQQLALVKERTKQFTDAASASFDQGVTSVAQFFAARKQAIDAQGAAELASARQRVAELSSAYQAQANVRANGPEAIQARTALREAENNVQMVQLQAEGQLAALVQERAAKEFDLYNAKAEFEKALAEAQGRTLDAALLGIDQQIKAYEKQLTQIGVKGEVAAAALKALRDAATGKAQVDAAGVQSDQLTQTIANNQSALDKMVAMGAMSQQQANIQQNRFVAAQAAGASAMINTFLMLRETLVGKVTPDVITSIDAQISKLQDVVVASQGAQTTMQQFQSDAVGAGGRSLLNFLSQLASGSGSVGDAFKQMAASFVQAIAQMVSQILALEVVTVVAKSLGVPIPKGFAEGGIVPGVGNADSVPAMLQPREFVLNRRMVEHFGGLEELEHLRRSLRGRTSLRRGYYAEGGAVTAAPAHTAAPVGSGLDVTRVIIEVHPDAVVRQIESGAGSRAVVKALTRNKNSANDALGRGSR